MRPVMNECATRMLRVVDVLRVATDGGARELLRVVLGDAPGAAGEAVP